MWMYFNSDKAFNFLKESGEVFTLRPAKERSPAASAIVDIRHKKKKTEFKARRTFLRAVMLDGPYDAILDTYAPRTGFESLEEWKDEALRLSGEHEFWNLFRVERL